MYVESIMTHPVITVDVRQRARDAALLLHARRFRHLPVMQEDALVGIVSDRDVRADDPRPLEEVVHRDVITVRARVPVESAAALMLENKVGCLPVLDDAGKLVGIVTETDLFRFLTRLFGGLRPGTRLQLELQDLPRQLATIAMLAREHGVPITTLVTEPDRDTGESGHRVALRVASIHTAPFVDALRGVGIKVDAPNWEHSGEVAE